MVELKWAYATDWIVWVHYPEDPQKMHSPGIGGFRPFEGKAVLRVSRNAGEKSEKHSEFHGLEFQNGNEALAFAISEGLLKVIVEKREKTFDELDQEIEELTGETPATRAVISKLNSDRSPMRAFHESVTKSSMPAFKEDAIRLLGDETEILQWQLDEADWVYIYREFTEES